MMVIIVPMPNEYVKKMTGPCVRLPANIPCEIRNGNNGTVQFMEIVAYPIPIRKK
jgi:hypothetical protein